MNKSLDAVTCKDRTTEIKQNESFHFISILYSVRTWKQYSKKDLHNFLQMFLYRT